MVLALLILTFIGSLCLTQWVYSFALKHLLDIPNQRSSHCKPTPRGGGLAIAIAYYAFLLIAERLQLITYDILLILACGLPVAAIGFWDDYHALSAKWRFLVHMLAAISTLLLMGGISGITTDTPGLLSCVILNLAVLFMIVWMLNLFNFMDGIDGIAGSEMLFVTLALSLLILQQNLHLALLSMGLGAATAGFLLRNWPPASIFMGDVGSGLLGFLTATLILLFTRASSEFLFIGLIVFAVFICDATYTLVYRLLDGQRWYSAHCSHAYQLLAKQRGHVFVLKILWAINLCWLFPLACLVRIYPEFAFILLVCAYLPLLFGIHMLGAGRMQTSTCG